MNLSPTDLNAITDLFISIVMIGLIFSFFLYSIIRKIVLSIIYKINFPYRIKTESGFLFRSHNGIYVTKQRLEDIDLERKKKKKQFWIKRFENQIQRLKND